MDADIPSLRHFAEIVQAVPAPSDAAPRAGADVAARQVATLDPNGLTGERYRELIDRFRAAIRTRLPEGPYAIEVLDRTAPDLDREAVTAFPAKGAYADILSGPWASGAFYAPRYTAAGPRCSITGFPPDYDIRARLSRPLRGAAIDTGPLDAEAFHWIALMHEVGHCLLGNSEARADTFAALMAIHEERVTADQVAAIARYREADEWTSPEPEDDHFVSAPLWEVVRRANGLRADKAFMALSVEQVAVLARQISNDYGPTLDELWDAQAVRRALLEVAAYPGFVEWVRAHPEQPVLRRLDAVLGNLVSGRGPLPRYRLDLPGFRIGMTRLAGGGDAFAEAILASLDAAPPGNRPYLDYAMDIPLARFRIGYRFSDVPEDAPDAIR